MEERIEGDSDVERECAWAKLMANYIHLGQLNLSTFIWSLDKLFFVCHSFFTHADANYFVNVCLCRESNSYSSSSRVCSRPSNRLPTQPISLERNTMAISADRHAHTEENSLRMREFKI